MTSSGGETTIAALREQGVTHIATYHSAHWCPPCRRFTPQLTETVKKLKANGTKMELIFVSSDRDEKSFKEYFGEMGEVLAIAPEDARKEKLDSLFEIEGIPTLVTMELAADGAITVINKDARGVASGDAEGEKWPWAPPLVADFDEDPSSLNDTPSFVVLAEKAEGAWDEVEASLAEVAKERKAAGKEPVAFGMIKEMGGGIGGQIRKLCKLGGATTDAQAVLLNLPNDGEFFAGPGKLDAATVRSYIEGFDAKTLPSLSVK
mmetsp:Transcript_13775/g.45314  ORF Transcript_13775/g.45314 Transcript_13775/m.45314 type:complete len:263 (+) Transcript_13775:361-1149(+)